MNEQTYGRGQVEWALWGSFTFNSVTADKTAPKIFRTRIKRLLEIDRGLDLGDVEVRPESDYACAVRATSKTVIARRWSGMMA